ncbi:MAG TPA: zf-HC2 domain-containing protein, partial [Acidobacteriota bacterium]|nr:zf-HC2 domain-containing protein [Acidobacteriota bacterium]HMZ79372.1 zf-HC2 domain-containing protein [Acidobacteriota bacterium]HNB73899.1 zf-HC2 domain-containing protein [Acidobacteriota bacterium]HND21428.1 zf-HC2 domain-containing protein [Acidobacteriota bacterium]HNG95622.1 zf-HC2 domain-containing protein [Acidobacteriota bacterium]
MWCWRIDIQRKLMAYLDSNLNPPGVFKVEQHLLDCASCRGQVEHLRRGQRFAMAIERHRAPETGWEALEAALDAIPVAERAKPVAVASHIRWLSWPGMALTTGLLVGGVLVGALWLAVNTPSTPSLKTKILESVEPEEESQAFHEVSISGIESNTEPHIVVEGVVNEVKIDADGDLTFRLVEKVNQATPFVVCEVLNPHQIKPPSPGDRVRVYGVSRYDNKHTHQWYEVHPVMNIELVRNEK